jgi:hypothetical protein
VKLLLSLLLGCALPLAAISQTVSLHEPCGSGILHAARVAEEPGFDRSFARLEATLRLSRSATRALEGVLRLPVVVHVLHTGEGKEPERTSRLPKSKALSPLRMPISGDSRAASTRKSSSS